MFRKISLVSSCPAGEPLILYSRLFVASQSPSVHMSSPVEASLCLMYVLLSFFCRNSECSWYVPLLGLNSVSVVTFLYWVYVRQLQHEDRKRIGKY